MAVPTVQWYYMIHSLLSPSCLSSLFQFGWLWSAGLLQKLQAMTGPKTTNYEFRFILQLTVANKSSAHCLLQK